MFTRACTCSVPSSDADVDVVSLGEDPRVAAWDNAEFENHAASVARGIDVRVGDVSLERDAVDDVLANRVDRERELLDRAEREPAATRLVARKAGLVEEQDVGACLCKPVRSRRPSRPRADDCDVEPLHQPKATMRRPGGVPERPKGTGCKPVGSAYGGSNPPAPTPSRSPRGCAEHGDFATLAFRSRRRRDASLRER